MNKIDFLKYTTFPLDSNTMDFMQKMIETVVGMSAVCGEKVIVSGCTVNGNHVSDGLVIIKGELLEFKGDVRMDKVYIEETREQVVCLEEAFDDLYIRRCVKFGNGDGVNNFNWSEFRYLDDIPVLMGKIAGLQSGKTDKGHTHTISDITNLPVSVVPKGLIAMWSGSTTAIPSGWTLCNKGYVYQGIFVPNLSGRFVVGAGSGKYDKAPNEDYSYNVGDVGGNGMVALSPEQMPSHTHLMKDYYFAESHLDKKGAEDGNDYISKEICGSATVDKDNHYLFFMNHDTYSRGGDKVHENRPPYYVLAYIIKL